MIRHSPLRAATALSFGSFGSRKVATAAGRVHVLDVKGRGKLPTVVLLHGFAAAGWTWAPLIRLLRPHVRRIVAPDLPAHGLSDVPRGELRVETMVEPLAAALDAVLDEPAVVFGNSLGGVFAVLLAHARPALTRAVALASPVGAAMTAAELDELLELFRVPTHRDALRFVDRLLVDNRTPLRRLYAWGVRGRFRRPHLRAFLERLAPGEGLDPEQLATLRLPVLLLWGRHDRILPPSHRAFFVRHVPPHAVVEEPDEHGHCPFLDDAGSCAERVLRFMRSL